MIVSIPLACVWELLTDSKLLPIKAYLSIGLSLYTIFVMIVTYLKLKLTFWDILKSIFILDSITLSTVTTSIAFIGLMKFLDRNKW